jgi:predicted Fe-S protein YdhL (DUF1289 family)
MVDSVTEFDVDAHIGPVPSPCCGICRMHPVTGLCEGCFRNIDEIIVWGGASDASKAAIWHQLQARAHLHFD